MMRIASTLVLLFALATTLVMATPTDTNQAMTLVSHPVQDSLPTCETEDGAGMALCWWDAQTMGNGMGTSVVSGDCAPDYVGGMDISALCVKLHHQSAQTYVYDDGVRTITGADEVASCIEIHEEAIGDERLADELKAQGWDLAHCFEAMIVE